MMTCPRVGSNQRPSDQKPSMLPLDYCAHQWEGWGKMGAERGQESSYTVYQSQYTNHGPWPAITLYQSRPMASNHIIPITAHGQQSHYTNHGPWSAITAYQSRPMASNHIIPITAHGQQSQHTNHGPWSAITVPMTIIVAVVPIIVQQMAWLRVMLHTLPQPQFVAK